MVKNVKNTIMKKSFLIFALIGYSLVGNGQSFIATDDLDYLLNRSCVEKKKIIIEFYSGDKLTLTDSDSDFLDEFYVTASAPIGGELGLLFGVRSQKYYFLDRDGYKIISCDKNVFMKNATRNAGNPSDCHIDDIRRNDDISTFTYEEQDGKNNIKKEETVTENYTILKEESTYSDTGEIDVTEYFDPDANIQASFSVKMETVEEIKKDNDIFTVQVDVFSTLAAAEKRAREVRRNPYVSKTVFINKTIVDELNGGVYYRVSTGKFQKESDCEAYWETLFRKLKPEALPNTKGWVDAIVKKINTISIIDETNSTNTTNDENTTSW